jgi:hypothetical protein
MFAHFLLQGYTDKEVGYNLCNPSISSSPYKKRVSCPLEFLTPD